MLDFTVDLTPEETQRVQFAKKALWEALNDVPVSELSDVDIELFGILSQDSVLEG